MWKVALLVMVGGFMLGTYGIREFILTMSSGSKPEPITAEELEAGVPDNPYRTLGPHVPIYQSVIYSQRRSGSGYATLEHAYYGVMSRSNPELAKYERAVEAVIKKYRGDPSRVPREEIPRLPDVRIIVKTDAYSSVGELKSVVEGRLFPSEKLTGMVTNRIESLSDDEIGLLRDSYPDFDPAKTVVFTAGKRPVPLMGVLLMPLVGAAMVIAPALIMWRTRNDA